MDRTMSAFAVLQTPVTSAVRLGDLHGERADASRGADDQDLLAGLHVSAVADRLQGGQAGNRHGRGLCKGEVRGPGRELVGPGPRVLGEGTPGDAEHLVAYRQRRHLCADRLDPPGDLPARHGGLGRPDPVSRQAHRIGQAGHEMQTPRSTPAACTRSSTSRSPIAGRLVWPSRSTFSASP
jgi:hypothetical protein